MVELGNTNPVTSSLGSTLARGTLLPHHGFTALLPTEVLGHGWHLGHSRGLDFWILTQRSRINLWFIGSKILTP